MRISFISKITLVVLLLSVAGASAMEYGDMPQSTNSVRQACSWLYKPFAGNKTAASKAGALVQAQVPGAAVQAAPSMSFSSKLALGIAGGAFLTWAATKIYTKQLYKNKVFLGAAGSAVALSLAWLFLKSHTNGE